MTPGDDDLPLDLLFPRRTLADKARGAYHGCRLGGWDGAALIGDPWPEESVLHDDGTALLYGAAAAVPGEVVVPKPGSYYAAPFRVTGKPTRLINVYFEPTRWHDKRNLPLVESFKLGCLCLGCNCGVAFRLVPDKRRAVFDFEVKEIRDIIRRNGNETSYVATGRGWRELWVAYQTKPAQGSHPLSPVHMPRFMMQGLCRSWFGWVNANHTGNSTDYYPRNSIASPFLSGTLCFPNNGPYRGEPNKSRAGASLEHRWNEADKLRARFGPPWLDRTEVLV